jgi:hypothetical protein
MSAMYECLKKGCLCAWEATDLISYPNPDCPVHSHKAYLKEIWNCNMCNKSQKFECEWPEGIPLHISVTPLKGKTIFYDYCEECSVIVQGLLKAMKGKK